METSDVDDFNAVQIRTIDIPEDDDLFDFLKDKPSEHVDNDITETNMVSASLITGKCSVYSHILA